MSVCAYVEQKKMGKKKSEVFFWDGGRRRRIGHHVMKEGEGTKRERETRKRYKTILRKVDGE